MLDNKIAVWDVIQSCDIIGSSDSSIKNVIPSDIEKLLKETNIRKIFANGAKAKELYDKYVLESTKREVIKLPSTSPANAAFSLEKLVKIWKEKIVEEKL